MNKQFFVITAMTLVLCACEKETPRADQELPREIQLNQSNSEINEPERPDEGGSDRAGASNTWYDYSNLGPPYSETDYGCMPVPGNCWNVVVVTGAQNISDFGDIFDVVALANRRDIIDIFALHEDLLDETMNASFVDDVISGILNVTCKGNFDTETAYLILKRGSLIVAAYPYER